MAWGANGGWFVANMIAKFNATALALQLLDTTNLRVALFGNAVTPDFSATTANSAYNAGTWLTSNEMPGSGNYTQGGTTVANPTLTDATGTMKWDFDDTQWASSTITSAYGALIYMNNLTPKSAILAVPFGGAYSTTNGTFTIQWAVAGVGTVDWTP